MKARTQFTQGITALALASALVFIPAVSCSDIDDAVNIDYGVYASPQLLELTSIEATISVPDSRNETYSPQAGDFKISDRLAAGDVGLYYWHTSTHFDRFDIQSTISVRYRLRDNIDFAQLQGRYVIAHGFVGSVDTRDKNGDWYNAPIELTPDAEVFDLPADAGALQTYLIDLQQSPDVARVSVNAVGLPTVQTHRSR